MKKTVKIIAVIILVVLAVGCIVLPLNRIVEQVQWLNEIKDTAKDDMYKAQVQSTRMNILLLGYPYFVLFILLVLNALFIVFDFSFLNFVTKFEKTKEKSKQKSMTN